MAFSKEDAVARQKAIDAGKTTYVRSSNGTRYTIRNLNNKRWQHHYGGQGGRDETSAARKVNRGGGSSGSRVINEKLATPDGADTKAYGKAMANANAVGMDGDHIQEVSRTADGIRYKEASGRGTRAQYHDNMKKAGVAVGNQKANVQPLPPDVNQRIKPAELRRMDNGIAASRGSFRGIVINNGSASFSYGLNMIAEYLPAIDEINGGHIDVAIQNGVNGIRNGVGLESNGVVRNTPERQVSELNGKIARSQEAIKNGGTIKLGPFTLPEFGVSELIGI